MVIQKMNGKFEWNKYGPNLLFAHSNVSLGSETCLTHNLFVQISTEANENAKMMPRRTTARSTRVMMTNPQILLCCLSLTSWSLSRTRTANAFLPSHYHHQQHLHGRLPFVTSSASKTELRREQQPLPAAPLRSTRLDRENTTTSMYTSFQPTLLEATYLSNSTMLDFILQTKPDFAVKKKKNKDFALFGCLVAEPGLGHATRDSVLQEIKEHQAAAASRAATVDRPNIAPRCTSPVPHMNSAPIFGLRPGSPAQYLIATTGERPMRFSICPHGEVCNVDDSDHDNHGLPAGLVLDERNGVITGTTQERGTFDVTLIVTNRHGVATRDLTIQVGDDIALTPPRGISTWNSCGDTVSAAKVRAIAAASIQHGLRDYGYTYINIDDGWQGSRDKTTGQMQPNAKFNGNMKELFDDLHALGFHCGIYGTPWKYSYACYPGSSEDSHPWFQSRPAIYIPNLFGWRCGNVKYEEQDADYFASIGADFLKWDWYQNDVDSTRRMNHALKRQGRDIVYSLSNSAPIKNAHHYQELSNMVRTTADIRDAWDGHAPRDAYCLSIKEIWRQHEKWAPYNKPGAWTDPDMLVVGPVGWGERHHHDESPHYKSNMNHLSLDEQLVHMTLWILWAAPLLIGCDLEKIDNDTLDMLCNRGALSINEDRLGIQGRTISRIGDAVVVSKPLANGDVAVGLFNTGEGSRREVDVSWKELGLDNDKKYSVHDVWADKELGFIKGGLGWKVRDHSAKLFRVSGKPSKK